MGFALDGRPADAALPRARPLARVLRLSPERALERAQKGFLTGPTSRCPKCHSTFVGLEPAFVHCRHCGTLARIAGAPLAVQEIFEMRAGLRSAG
jgi:hypothetical protein